MIKQDDELDKLEEDIRKLKNKYDQFFSGIIRVPPAFERHQLESQIHELNRQKFRDKTRRFRFTTILSRFNQYRELWGRKMRESEEGPLDFRRRQALMSQKEAPHPENSPEPRVTSRPADPYVKMTPGVNGAGIRELYDAVRQEHIRLGQKASLTIEQLAAMVQKQSDVVRAKYNVTTVGFRVDTVDGKVKLKAKPLQD
ncbi:MAG TPA: MXAN_5187 C-terminal domain-containing protein [Thermoanaerobaculia bacterium]